MKNPLLFVALNHYIRKVVASTSIKNIVVKTEEPNIGFMYYDVGPNTNNIPPISDPYEVVRNTAAGLLIMEGYVVTSALEDTYIVSNNRGDTYFIQGSSCTCADRFSPCKHVLFSDWYKHYRKSQVKLLHETKD